MWWERRPDLEGVGRTTFQTQMHRKAGDAGVDGTDARTGVERGEPHGHWCPR